MKSELYFPKDETKVSVGRVSAPEVVVPADNEVQAHLRATLARLGPGGEHWVKGAGSHRAPKICGRYCVMEASAAAARAAENYELHCWGAKALDRAAREKGIGKAYEFNDAAETSWEDLCQLILRAIELAA